jgi:hypothetical protein
LFPILDLTADFRLFDFRWACDLRRADGEREVIWFEPVYAFGHMHFGLRSRARAGAQHLRGR